LAVIETLKNRRRLPVGAGADRLSGADISALQAPQRALGQLADVTGGVATILGQKAYRAEGDAQAIEGIAAVKTRMLAEADSQETNTDWTTYKAGFDKAFKELDGITEGLTNRRGKLQVEQFITANKPLWNNNLNDMIIKRQNDNTIATSDSWPERTKDLDLTNIDGVLEAENEIGKAARARLGTGRFAPAEVGTWIENALSQMDNQAIFQNSLVIAATKGIDEAEDFVMKSSIATADKRRIVSDLNFEQSRADAGRIALINEVNTKVTSLAANEDFVGAQNMLNENLELIGLKEHGIRSRQLKATSEFFGATGVNYYKETHKLSVREDLKRRILAGTLKDSALIWQRTGFNGISDTDAGRLAKMIPDGGTEKDFKDSDAAIMYKEMFDASLIGRSKSTLSLFALETGYRWLEDSLKEHPEWTIRQSQEEAMRIAARVDAAALADEITERPEELPGDPFITPEEVRRGMEKLDKIDLSEIRRRRLDKQAARIETITTQEQYNALPKGARYRDSNGNIGIKR